MDDSKYIKILEELVSSVYFVDTNRRTLKISNHHVLAGKNFKNEYDDVLEAVAKAHYSQIIKD